jgi:transcriptional regulator with XRE-family HTH domain
MRSLADLARQRIIGWMAANRQITQARIASAVGVSQSWVSLYKSGDVDADIDQLAAIASVYGHTLMELIDLRPDPKERELLDAYRAIEAAKRPLAIEVVRALSVLPPPAPVRKRNG